MIRQEQAAEKGIVVSLRTVDRRDIGRELAGEATARFEIPSGKQLQIALGERLFETAGSKLRAYLVVATLDKVLAGA